MRMPQNQIVCDMLELARLFKTDGTVSTVELPPVGERLETLQGLVGGNIEAYYETKEDKYGSKKELSFYFDENGLNKRLSVNPHFPHLVGDVVVIEQVLA